MYLFVLRITSEGVLLFEIRHGTPFRKARNHLPSLRSVRQESAPDKTTMWFYLSPPRIGGKLYMGKTIPEIFPGVRRFFTLNKKLIKSILVD